MYRKNIMNKDLWPWFLHKYAYQDSSDIDYIATVCPVDVCKSRGPWTLFSIA